MYNLIIGSHVSFKKDDQIVGSIKEALGYGANTFMFYTGAPQNTNRMPIDEKLVIEGKKILEENNIDINNVVVHAPYIINLANPEKSDFGINFLKQEIQRCEVLGMKMLVLHPGSHVGVGEEEGINNIAEALNKVGLDNTNVTVCLETMAGKGSEVGYNFNQIASIINKVKNNDKLKVCLDTCHINDSGYDLSDFDNILNKFDNIIGLDRLACIHINDSKNEIGTHKDRHENIGYGTIGFDKLLKVIYHEKLNSIPKILETPYVDIDGNKYPPYKFEIMMIRDKKFNTNLIQDIENYYK